jgi:diguanylate cyclase (GGDEF)-like protein
MSDVQYLIEKQQTLEVNSDQDSDRDPLTGLLNRQGAMDRLRQDLSRAKREQVHLLLVMLDIEGFEGVTGAFGYKMGEVSLIRTADLLLSNIRSGDWAARWDGDCFLAVLWNYHHAPATVIKERLQQVTVETLEGEMIKLSLIVGTWSYEGQGDLTSVLSHIQEALAEARRNMPDMNLHTL